MDLEKRMKMAAESILENESLREGLDDEAASALLDWGMARAKKIAANTADLEDDDEAEEASYPQMRGLRDMLRAVAGLCAEDLDPETQSGLLQEIADQISAVYGTEVTLHDRVNWNSFLMAFTESNAQKIIGFRALLEENANPIE